jgi:hypothetical protein
MTAMISIGLIIAGLLLLIHCLESSRSIASHLSRFVADDPAVRAMGLIVCGMVCSMIGVAGPMPGRRS